MIDPTYQNYISNQIYNFTEDRYTGNFRDASCNLGGDFPTYIHAFEYIKKQDMENTLCPISNSDLYIISNLSGQLLYPRDCKNYPCVPKQNLSFCQANQENPSLLETYEIEKSKPNFNIENTVRLIVAPFWRNHVLDLNQSPLFWEVFAGDQIGFASFDATHSPMLYTDFDSGNHVACLNQSDGNCSLKNQIYLLGDADHAVLLVNSSPYQQDNSINVTIRNSWGTGWGVNGNLLARLKEPYECTQDTDCTTQFGNQLSNLNWKSHGWTLKCGGIFKYQEGVEQFTTKKFCIPALENNVSPQECVQPSSAACPTQELINAGGRCSSYYYKEENGQYFPESQNTYCLPTMPDTGVTAITVGTLYWND